jgi:PEP-CTERM motif
LFGSATGDETVSGPNTAPALTPSNGGPYSLWSDPGPSPPPNSYAAGEIVGGGEAEPLGTGFVSLNPGQTYLLGQVQFSVPAGASLTDEFNVSLNTGATGVTEFADQNGSALGFTWTPSLVTLTVPVPEPSSLLTGIMGVAGMVAVAKSRRRR